MSASEKPAARRARIVASARSVLSTTTKTSSVGCATGGVWIAALVMSPPPSSVTGPAPAHASRARAGNGRSPCGASLRCTSDNAPPRTGHPAGAGPAFRISGRRSTRQAPADGGARSPSSIHLTRLLTRPGRLGDGAVDPGRSSTPRRYVSSPYRTVWTRPSWSNRLATAQSARPWQGSRERQTRSWGGRRRSRADPGQDRRRPRTAPRSCRSPRPGTTSGRRTCGRCRPRGWRRPRRVPAPTVRPADG